MQGPLGLPGGQGREPRSLSRGAPTPSLLPTIPYPIRSAKGCLDPACSALVPGALSPGRGGATPRQDWLQGGPESSVQVLQQVLCGLVWRPDNSLRCGMVSKLLLQAETSLDMEALPPSTVVLQVSPASLGGSHSWDRGLGPPRAALD